MIPSIWMIKLVLTWIISSFNCETEVTTDNIGNVQTSFQSELIRYDTDPITHMEMSVERRQRRTPNNSAFDRGYEDFLRNYYNDNGIERAGRYRVKESETSESDESTSAESDESESDERSNESEETTRKNANKSKNSGKTNRQKDHPTNKKKMKHCKTEKRGNMLCNICYNPKNDEKSESCSFNSEPKQKNYAYSTDNKFENKNSDREKFEDDDDRDNSESGESSEEDEASDEKSSDDEKMEEKRKSPPPSKKPPQRRPSQHGPGPFRPRFFPPFQQRQNPNLVIPSKYGPQVFPPQYRGAPVRIQLNNAPPNVALIRYRTIGTPNGNQHIRIITYPDGRSQTQFMRPTQDLRPPRDVNGAQSESFQTNVTKEHEFEYFPIDKANQELAEFMSRDWSNCKKSVEDKQICFECFTNGSRRKQCMFASQLKKKPENFYRSYSKSNKFEHRHPYSFELPLKSTSQHSKSKLRKNKQQKPTKSSNSDESNSKSISNESREPAPVYENHSTDDWKATDFIHNGKQQPHAQPLRSVAEIIYGTTRPGSEPLGLFFKTDHTHFNATTTAKP